MNIVVGIIALIVFIKCLDLIYLFQIKEYRFDRLLSHIKDQGIFPAIFFNQLRLPAKSIRNIIVITISAIFIFLLLFFIKLPQLTLLLIIIFLPLLSFLIILPGILITSIMAFFSRQAIINRARKRIKKSKTIFIAITGSFGKTTTKEFLFSILSQKYIVAKTDENMNTPVGVALSVLKNLTPKTEFFIAEIGAYKTGEIKTVCDYIHPTHGILTGISNQHIDLFGSKENLMQAKKELFESLPKNGKAYLNMDFDDYSYFQKNISCPVNTFSLKKKIDIWAENIFVSKNGTTATIHSKNQSFSIKTSLIGSHFIANLLPCINLALDLKIETEKIQQAISNLKQIDKRLSFNTGINGSLILNDSYNTGLHSFQAAIETGELLKMPKQYLITRGIIELGQEKTNSYLQILNILSKSNIVLVTTDSLFKKLDKNGKTIYFSSEKDLTQFVVKHSDKQTLIIIEGKFNPTTIKQLTQNSK